MILSDTDIQKLFTKQDLIVEPLLPGALRESAIKLHLGSTIQKHTSAMIDVQDSNTISLEEIALDSNGYVLEPGEMILGITHEKVTIPNTLMGWIETRGSMARLGLTMHFCDAHIDPGSSLRISLQIKNMNHIPVKIYPEMYCVKLYLLEMKTDSSGYQGAYQNQDETEVIL